MNEKKEFVSRRRFVRDTSFAGATMLAKILPGFP
jgi:hypothetical protein